MCSEYQVHTNASIIEKTLDVPIFDRSHGFDWEANVKIFKSAPVILKSEKGQFELAIKTFPTSPMPNSRLSGLEVPTDDGKCDDEEIQHKQIKRIYDMKYWGQGFKNHPVLIPMTQFLEFAYWGPQKGTAQGFKIPETEVFFAAGILIKPFKPKGPDFSAFSILTHTATKQMLKFHFRLITLLTKEVALGYLQDMTAQDRFDYLIENRYTGELQVEKIRSMAKNWEKRMETQLRKLDHEKTYRKILKQNHVAG